VHVNGSWAESAEPTIRDAREISVEDTLLGWSFSVRPRGYIVVPALKELPPVKVYSERHDLNVDDRDGFARFLREMLLYRVRTFAREYGDPSASQPATGDVLLDPRHRETWDRYTVSPEEFAASLRGARGRQRWTDGPLLTTAWHQFGPYFDLCPVGDEDCEDCDNGNEPDTTSTTCLTGCVATALAQIVRFHEWPAAGGSHTYHWDGDETCVGDPSAGADLFADYQDGFDWASMPDTCDAGSPQAEKDAVAELCFEIGVAAEMDYGRCASSADPLTALTTLVDCLGYDPSFIVRARFDPCYSPAMEDWWDFLRYNIERGWPILYIIPSPTLYDPPHAIVCDGIGESEDDDFLYHMNYGWADEHTAWYVVDELAMSGGPEGEIAYAYLHPRPLGWRDNFSVAQAASETLHVSIPRSDEVLWVNVEVTSNQGITQSAYAMTRVDSSSTWILSGGVSEFVAGATIWYRLHVRRTELEKSYRIPSEFAWYTFSFLPRYLPPLRDPLLVFKGRPVVTVSGGPYSSSGYLAMDNVEHASFVEALGVLGYGWDRYTPEFIGTNSNGPDTAGMKYYDTQIWVTGDVDDRPLTPRDQSHLIEWLAQSAEGKERNLVVVGKHIGYDMIEAGHETLGFYENWLAASQQGVVTDAVVTLREYPGGYVFMDHDDGECVVAASPEGGLDSGCRVGSIRGASTSSSRSQAPPAPSRRSRLSFPASGRSRWAWPTRIR